ncbi:MAG: hypothetical protein M1828_000155 [Chrysothrix sp. TS-e1954]|nr:MAG: hypothetical protein M1828_000155 [Chrysothrix sp. TS-e1954]
MGNASSSSNYPRIEDDPYFADPLRSRSEVALVTEPASDEYYSRNTNNRLELRQKLFGTIAEEPDRPKTSHVPQTSQESLSSAVLSPQRSIRVGNRPVNVQSAINILQELKKTASPEDLSALQQALSPEQTSQAIEDTTAGSDPTITRRSSRYTPGIATRSSLGKPLRKKSLSRGKTQAQTWSPDMFVASPLAALAKLQGKDGQPQKPRSRPETPGEGEHLPLGAYQLGSLRITNGIATPEPSICGKTAVKREMFSHGNESYFTAPEGADSSDVDLTSDAEEGDTISPIVDEKFHADYFTCRSLIPPSNDVRSITPPESLRSSCGTNQLPLSRRTTNNSSVCSSATTPLEPPNAARLYLRDVSSNPFLPPDAKPQIDVIKHASDTPGFLDIPATNNVDDESIYSDRPHSNQPSPNEPSPSTVHESRQNTLQALNSNAAKPKTSADSLLSPDLGYQRTSSPDQLNEKLSWQTDSDSCAPQSETLAEPLIDTMNTPTSKYTRAVRPPIPVIPSIRDRNLDDETMSVSTMVDIKHMLRTDPPWASRTSQSEQVQRQNQSPAWPLRPQFASHSTSDVRPPPSQEEAPPAIPAPSDTKTESETKPAAKKLLKKRRPTSTQQPKEPVVLLGNSHMGSVPSVPSAMVFKHAQRLNDSPGMEHLNHTYDSVSICDTQIDSPTAPSAPQPEIRFPSPDPADDMTTPTKRGRRNARPVYEPPSSGGLFRSRSKSRKRSKSKTRSASEDREDYIGVADFGSVAESLGSSPYEIAQTVFNKAHPERAAHMQNQHGRRQSIVHPHQMAQTRQTQAPPPAKTIVGMDEKAAAQLALQRSRDRQACFDDRVAYTAERPPPLADLRRPKSFRSKSLGGPPVPPKDLKTTVVLPTDEVFANNPEDGHADEARDDWTTSSAHWRQRRKSIGEGLLNRQPTPGPNPIPPRAQDQAPKSPPASRQGPLMTSTQALIASISPTSTTASPFQWPTPTPAPSEQQQQEQEQPTPRPSRPSLKSKKTFPSIRDRALLFEQKARDSASPSPSHSPARSSPSRTPSPTRHGDPAPSPPEKPPTPQQDPDQAARLPKTGSTRLRIQSAELFIPSTPPPPPPMLSSARASATTESIPRGAPDAARDAEAVSSPLQEQSVRPRSRQRWSQQQTKAPRSREDAWERERRLVDQRSSRATTGFSSNPNPNTTSTSTSTSGDGRTWIREREFHHNFDPKIAKELGLAG